ncbi:hypothetical protein GCM10023196_007260 [Actinoallomurus vinaceus]|uniref:Secreted protein n=1 Tax=Actinoallomurus vinaceus TaxID=1080074 RepID=A0ABP8U0J2_9ACTN
MSTQRISRRVGMLSAVVAASFALAPMASAATAPASAKTSSPIEIAASKKTSFVLSGLGTRLSGIPKGKGWVGWHDGWVGDKAEWAVRITDISSATAGNRTCARARIIADLAKANDDEYTSKKVCGKGKHIDWKVTTGRKAFMRGVKVQVCQDYPVANIPKCTTKKYIKNPYYKY